jgi:hypothetical protein
VAARCGYSVFLNAAVVPKSGADRHFGHVLGGRCHTF